MPVGAAHLRATEYDGLMSGRFNLGPSTHTSYNIARFALREPHFARPTMRSSFYTRQGF